MGDGSLRMVSMTLLAVQTSPSDGESE
jgi:hypothetical protein